MKPTDLLEMIQANYDEAYSYAAERESLSDDALDADKLIAEHDAWNIIRDALTGLEGLDK